MYIQGILQFVEKKQKILHESYPPGPRLTRHVYSSILLYIQKSQSLTIALDEMLQFGTYRVEKRTSGIHSDGIYRSSMQY